jgi:hypothetical protein
MILDSSAIRFGKSQTWPSASFKRAGREPFYGKLHARGAKRFFSNNFRVPRRMASASLAQQKKPEVTNLAACKLKLSRSPDRFYFNVALGHDY